MSENPEILNTSTTLGKRQNVKKQIISVKESLVTVDSDESYLIEKPKIHKKKKDNKEIEDEFIPTKVEAKPKKKKNENNNIDMSKPKKKDPKLESETEEKMIFDYMADTNRPYSIQNIIDNLKGKVVKKKAEAALEKLVIAQKLVVKDFGKNRIYLVNQNLFPSLNEDEIKVKEDRISELNQQFMELNTAERESNEEIRKVTATPNDRDLLSQLTRYEKSTREKIEAIGMYEAMEDQLMSLKEVEEVEKSMNEIKKNCRIKQKLVHNILMDIIGDNDIKVNDLKDKIGLSIDD